VTQDFSVSRTGEGAWRIEGELDLATAPTFEDALTADDGPGDLELDCSGLLFMDSQGVRSVMVVAAGRPVGRRLVLRGLSPQVRRIVDLVQLGAAPGVVVED
jgi:anti-anti-sigma factor